jgi:extracellular factor (EF) 3-hydroxypalmitic acid methyl ester biosynthesis protein
MDQEIFDNTIKKLFDKNGPDDEDFDSVLEFVDQIEPEEVDKFREAMQPILNPSTLIGFSFTKPFGYNGDFFIIEKIYQKYANPNPKYTKWDAFIHRLPVAIAVVNRKKLAKEILTDLNNNANGGLEKSVLILGSGPVTEVNEYMNETPGNKLVFDMIDLDQRAIDYAKNKNKAFLNYMNFEKRNVIRFVPEKCYDLIWSAGLFDYFKDKHFVYLIKKFYQHVNPGGEMIIGNFGVQNPSRKIMEILADWFLYHRSEEELIGFAKQAGIPSDNVEILKEPLGINLFLRAKK